MANQSLKIPIVIGVHSGLAAVVQNGSDII